MFLLFHKHIPFLLFTLFIFSTQHNTKLLSSLSLSYSNILIQNYTSLQYLGFMMPLDVGEPDTKMELQLDMNNDISWISKFAFTTQSKTLYKHSPPFSFIRHNITHITTEHTDYASLLSPYEGNVRFNFSFMFAAYGQTEHPSFALSRKYYNERFNTVNNMKLAKHISHTAFTIINHNTKRSNGSIVFGDITNNKILYNEYYKGVLTPINIDDSDISWSVKLKQISFMFNNKEYVYPNTIDNDIVLFQTTFYGIHAPSSFLRYLRNIMANEGLFNQNCVLFALNKVDIFQCKTDISTYFKNFYFDFGNIRINLGNLIIKENEYTYSLLIGNYNKYYKDKWIFGTVLYDKYILTFDIDKDIIYIYSKDKLTNDTYTKYIITICIIILICGISLISLIIFKLIL